MHELLSAFAVVVEKGSLNQAAKKLNLSQPALSRKMSRLEDELGVLLFEREGKKLRLTRTGQITYEYALEFRDLYKHFQQAIASFKNEGKKSMTIGASLTTLQSTLPDLIGLLTTEEPDADIKAITGKTHEILKLVENRKVDIGLVASRVEHETVKCIPLFEDHLSLVLPQGHRLTRRGKVTVHDLENLPMILFSKGTWYRILMDELFRRFSFDPEIKMEIDSFEAILRLVTTCQAASLLPESYLRPSLLENNGLVRVQIEELKQTTRTTSLIYTDFGSLNPLAKKLAEKAVAYY